MFFWLLLRPYTFVVFLFLVTLQDIASKLLLSENVKGTPPSSLNVDTPKTKSLIRAFTEMKHTISKTTFLCLYAKFLPLYLLHMASSSCPPVTTSTCTDFIRAALPFCIYIRLMYLHPFAIHAYNGDFISSLAKKKKKGFKNST